MTESRDESIDAVAAVDASPAHPASDHLRSHACPTSGSSTERYRHRITRRGRHRRGSKGRPYRRIARLPGRVRRPLTEREREQVQQNAMAYLTLAANKGNRLVPLPTPDAQQHRDRFRTRRTPDQADGEPAPLANDRRFGPGRAALHDQPGGDECGQGDRSCGDDQHGPIGESATRLVGVAGTWTPGVSVRH